MEQGGKDKGKPNFSEEFVKFLPGSNQNKKVSDEVLQDIMADCRDPITPSGSGYTMFTYFYNNRGKSIPICNVWALGMAKIIVPNVFLDVDLIIELARLYDPISNTIRKSDQSALVTLDRGSFMKAFDLYSSSSIEIDLKGEREKYMSQVGLVKSEMVKHIPKTGKYIAHLPVHMNTPYEFKCLNFYMNFLCHGLCRVLGMDGRCCQQTY